MSVDFRCAEIEFIKNKDHARSVAFSGGRRYLRSRGMRSLRMDQASLSLPAVILESRLYKFRNTSETAGLRVGHVCKYTPLPLALVSCVLQNFYLRERHSPTEGPKGEMKSTLQISPAQNKKDTVWCPFVLRNFYFFFFRMS